MKRRTFTREFTREAVKLIQERGVPVADRGVQSQATTALASSAAAILLDRLAFRFE